MVGRTVAQYMAAGIAALHLEDQVQNKRCGHLGNKELVPEDIYLARIRAAVNMREQTTGDIVIIARSDALQSMGFNESVARLKKATSLGADIAFLEGILNMEQCKRVCEELHPSPVLYNMVQGGVSPQLTVDQAKELGFKIIIFPSLCTRAAYEGVGKAMQNLKETGVARTAVAGTKPKTLFELCGMTEAIEFDIAAGGLSYTKGV